jgi:ribonuclease HI
MYTAVFDGSAQPNPGIKHIGGAVYKDGKTIYTFSIRRNHGTNNEAEYEALIEIASYLNGSGIEEVEITGDSMLVVNQVNGLWKCNVPQLQEYKEKIIRLLSGIKYSLKHVPREQNTFADKLSKGT